MEGGGSYYHLNHSELVSLLLQRDAELKQEKEEYERRGLLLEKREVELKKMKVLIRDLEDYIDTLLVRIMEQTPALLQVRPKMKWPHRDSANISLSLHKSSQFLGRSCNPALLLLPCKCRMKQIDFGILCCFKIQCMPMWASHMWPDTPTHLALPDSHNSYSYKNFGEIPLSWCSPPLNRCRRHASVQLVTKAVCQSKEGVVWRLETWVNSLCCLK